MCGNLGRAAGWRVEAQGLAGEVVLQDQAPPDTAGSQL